jgi:hypothetical protein
MDSDRPRTDRCIACYGFHPPGACPVYASFMPARQSGKTLRMQELSKTAIDRGQMLYLPESPGLDNRDGADPHEECGRWDNGRLTRNCAKAGTEDCVFCPYARSLNREKIRNAR